MRLVGSPDISKADLRQARVFFLMVALSIEQLPQAIKEAVEDYLGCHPRSPAAKLRPQMGLEGDVWLAFIGIWLLRDRSRGART